LLSSIFKEKNKKNKSDNKTNTIPVTEIISTDSAEIESPSATVDEELDNVFENNDSTTKGAQTNPNSHSKEILLTEPNSRLNTTKNDVIKVAPIHITIDVRVKITLDDATKIFAFTYRSFNLKRWDYPFGDLKFKRNFNIEGKQFTK